MTVIAEDDKFILMTFSLFGYNLPFELFEFHESESCESQKFGYKSTMRQQPRNNKQIQRIRLEFPAP